MYMYFIWNVCGSIVNETSGTASLLGNVILLEFNGEYHMSGPMSMRNMWEYDIGYWDIMLFPIHYVGKFLYIYPLYMHCMPTPMKYKPPVLNCFKHFTEQNNDIKNIMIKATKSELSV